MSVRQHKVLFYASGAKGKEVRADGKGGYLFRGYYLLINDTYYGPYPTKRAVIEALENMEAKP